jgi:GNAT superfamily N-acetyltransferase
VDVTDLLRVSSPAQISALAELAQEIWTEHYTPIIGPQQVDYMLASFQSAEAIAAQLAEGYEYYLATRDGGGVGYIALVPDAGDASLMISKLYVAKSERGRGFGREMLSFAEKVCRERHLVTLWLTVNKNNIRSIEWYAKMGFSNAGPIVQDIGAGFAMDDYRLTKVVV